MSPYPKAKYLKKYNLAWEHDAGKKLNALFANTRKSTQGTILCGVRSYCSLGHMCAGANQHVYISGHRILPFLGLLYSFFIES